MTRISIRVRRAVLKRANGRCEYCGLAQAGQAATFHIEHVVPIADDGSDHPENLAAACVSCSLRKGARRLAPDPDTGEPTALFSPRTDRWDEHFRWEGTIVIGLTAIGRATIAALALNRPGIQAIRYEEAALGRHPPERMA